MILYNSGVCIVVSIVSIFASVSKICMYIQHMRTASHFSINRVHTYVHTHMYIYETIAAFYVYTTVYVYDRDLMKHVVC